MASAAFAGFNPGPPKSKTKGVLASAPKMPAMPGSQPYVMNGPTPSSSAVGGGLVGTTAPAGVGAAGGAGGGGAAGSYSATPLQSTAQTSPDMAQFQNDIRDRLSTLRGKEGQGDPNLQTQVNRLGDRMSSDTRESAQNFAAQDVGGRARAANAALTEQLARRGIRNDTNFAAEQQQQIETNAMRENARNAAQIGMGHEQRLDALTLGGQQIMSAPGQYGLARENMTNNMLPLALQGANSVANQNLADRGLNLEQWKAQNQINLASRDQDLRAGDSEMAKWMAIQNMFKSGGAGSYF